MRISKSEIAYLRSLSQKKFRDREQKFVIEGWRVLNDALKSDFHIDLVGVTPKKADEDGVKELLGGVRSRGITVKEMTELDLKRVSDTVHAQGVIALVRMRQMGLDGLLAGTPSLVVVADRVADPGNLGSIVRSCDWFGADALLLSEGSVELYNEKVIRSTAGSVFHIPVIENVDLKGVLPRLKKNGFHVLATAGDARTSYTNAAHKSRNVIVVGSEATGLDPTTIELADEVVRIPRNGNAESLNVGVACGIILAHLRNTKE
jgi:TrmH family RNA methyltransferase